MKPTLCARCGKNVAVIFITKLENGQAKNEGLCLKCARELHIKPVDDIINRMGISDEDLEGLAGEMTTALNDFYVEYEINAFTDDAVRLPAIYSALHQNLLKSFFDEGVEIMSPHIIARRDGIDLQMPADYQPKA